MKEKSIYLTPASQLTSTIFDNLGLAVRLTTASGIKSEGKQKWEQIFLLSRNQKYVHIFRKASQYEIIIKLNLPYYQIIGNYPRLTKQINLLKWHPLKCSVPHINTLHSKHTYNNNKNGPVQKLEKKYC